MPIKLTDSYNKILFDHTFQVSGGVTTETKQATQQLFGSTLSPVISVQYIVTGLDAPIELTFKQGNTEVYTEMPDLIDGNDTPIVKITSITNGFWSYMRYVFLGVGFDPLTATTGSVRILVKLG